MFPDVLNLVSRMAQSMRNIRCIRYAHVTQCSLSPECPLARCLWLFHRYLVTELMGSDLHKIVRTQALTDEHVKFFIYQIMRGLKV